MSEETLGEQAQRPYESKLLRMLPVATGIATGAGLAGLMIAVPESVPYVVGGGFVSGVVANMVASTSAIVSGGVGVGVGCIVGAGIGLATIVSGADTSSGTAVGVASGFCVGVGVGARAKWLFTHRDKATKYLGAALLTGSAMFAGSYLKPDTEIEAVRQFQTDNDRGVVITLGEKEIPYIEREGLFIKFDDERKRTIDKRKGKIEKESDVERENWNKRLEEIIKPADKK